MTDAIGTLFAFSTVLSIVKITKWSRRSQDSLSVGEGDGSVWYLLAVISILGALTAILQPGG